MNLIFLVLILVACFIASIALARWVFQQLATWERLDRLMAASTPVLILILGGLILREFVSSPFRDQNAPLLTPSLAILYGYNLYYSPDNGPVLDTMYGPVNYLVYLPSALGNNPTFVILLGELITVLFYFLPILWLHIREHIRDSKILRFSGYVFLLFCFLTIYIPPLNSTAFMIHADAPALGFCAIACGIIYDEQRRRRIFPLLLSATFAVLAVWTKQITIPIVFALPTYVLLAQGFKSFIRYVGCIAVAGSVISTLIFLICNPQALIYNIFTIPMRQPWVGYRTGLVPPFSFSGLLSLVEFAQTLMNYCLVFGVILILYTCYQLFFDSKQQKKSIRQWFSDNPWTMLVITSLFMVPTLLLAIVKIGGNINNYGFALYFLVTAVNLVLIKTVSDSTLRYSHFTRKVTKLLVYVLVLAIAFIQIPEMAPIFVRLPNLARNPQQVAYDYARKHPGEVFFPWNPLSTLMAEGKLYHSAYGLFDREKAGIKLSDEQFRANIPANLKLVAFSSRLVLRNTLKYLPEFTQQVTVDELPGWIVFSRK